MGVLFGKIKILLEKQAKIAQRSPLTQLPGGEYVKRIIANKLFRDEHLAACYFTLSHFAPYVKVYGPEKRDESIKMVGEILREVTQETGVYECSIGHLGGADFMVLLSVKDFERYCSEAVSRFKQRRHELYSTIDLERGGIHLDTGNDGKGDFSLMSLIVGVTTNESIKFRDSAQMFKVAGEVNKRAHQKQENGHIEVFREGILL
jgi:GGDEF domain-containing protein